MTSELAYMCFWLLIPIFDDYSEEIRFLSLPGKFWRLRILLVGGLSKRKG